MSICLIIGLAEDPVFTMIFERQNTRRGGIPRRRGFVLLTVQPLPRVTCWWCPRRKWIGCGTCLMIPTSTYWLSKQMQAKLKSAYPSYKRIGYAGRGFGVPHAHVHVFGYDELLEPTIEHHVAWKSTLENGMIGADELKSSSRETLRRMITIPRCRQNMTIG